MFLTVLVVLYVSAFICTLLSTTSPSPRVPLWIGVLLLCLAGLLTVLPLGGTNHTGLRSSGAAPTAATG